MRLVLFICFYFYVEYSPACTPADKFKERCDQHCIDDQEPPSWVPSPFVCLCGKAKDLKLPVSMKLPRTFTGEAVIKPETVRSWVE